MNKLFLFLVLCFLTIQSIKSQELSNNQKKKLITSVSDLLVKNYVFEDDATAVSAFLNNNFKNGKYKSVNDTQKFIDLIVSDIRSINNDQHLDIYFLSNKKRSQGSKTTLPTSLLEERGAKNNYGIKEIKVLDGNIGYLNISNFSLSDYFDEAKKTFKSSMNFVGNTDALILDMRNNPGGSNDLTIFLLSYFFSKENKHLWDVFDKPSNKTTKYYTDTIKQNKYVDKPVFILLNSNSFSAPEAFAYSLKHYGKAKVIGEKSYGGAHPTLVFKIDEEFSVQIPTSRIINPITNTDWEQKGVIPDIQSSSDKALVTAQIMALEKLNENQPKEEYQTFIKSLKSIENPLVIDEKILESYTGKYELGPNRILTITKSCEFLYGQMTGDENKIKLIALNENTFKAKDIDAQITFHLEETRGTSELTFSIGNNTMNGKKVK